MHRIARQKLSIMTLRFRVDSTTLTLDDRIRVSLTSTWLICCPDPSHTTSVFAGFSRNLLADNHDFVSSLKIYGRCCITDRNADVYNLTVVGVLMETHTVLIGQVTESKLIVVKLLSSQIQNPRTNNRLKHFWQYRRVTPPTAKR